MKIRRRKAKSYLAVEIIEVSVTEMFQNHVSSFAEMCWRNYNNKECVELTRYISPSSLIVGVVVVVVFVVVVKLKHPIRNVELMQEITFSVYA